MSNYNNDGGAQWGDDRTANAAKHNPFTAGKSGPPVFFRSKATPAGDGAPTEAPVQGRV